MSADSSPAAAEAPASKSKVETLEGLVTDWRKLFTKSLDGTEKLARERPWVVLIIAFVAGVLFDELLRAIFRRRR